MQSTPENRRLGREAGVPHPASVGGAVALICLYSLVQFVVVVAGYVSLPAAQLFSQVVGWMIVLYVAARGSGTWRSIFPSYSFSVRLVLPVMVLCAGISVLFAQISSLISRDVLFDRGDLGQSWYLVVSAVVVAPVFEETFFRGWLLSGLRARYSVRKAIIISSLLFAVLHLRSWEIITAFPFGVFLAWLVVRTGSVGPGVLGHAAANAMVGVTIVLMRMMGYSDARLNEMTLLPPAVLVAAVLFVVTGWHFLVRAVSSSTPDNEARLGAVLRQRT